jgi:hypothetical protein
MGSVDKRLYLQSFREESELSNLLEEKWLIARKGEIGLKKGESMGRLIKRLQLPLSLKRCFFGKPTISSVEFTGIEVKVDAGPEIDPILGWLQHRHNIVKVLFLRLILN